MDHQKKPDSPRLSAPDRRRFLQLSAASLALAGGCGVQPPLVDIVPYVDSPQGITPGKLQYYATTLTLRGSGIGVMATCREGRPTKIEGNPNHPASLGATDAILQASILGLYDPERSATVLQGGEPSTWDAAFEAASAAMTAQRDAGGAGFRLVTGEITSPTMLAQVESLLSELPDARWIQFEPISADAARRGAQIAFGEIVDTVYHFDKADVVVSLDADVFALGPGKLRYAHDFMARREIPDVDDGHDHAMPSMNRLYVLESTPSITGASADHRWALPPDRIEALALALAARLGVPAEAPQADLPLPSATFDAMVGDLQSHRGHSIVVAGEHQSPAVHALVHAINDALGNHGATVDHASPAAPAAHRQTQSLDDLVKDIEAGTVDMLVLLDSNPVYAAPGKLDLAAKLTAKDADGNDLVPTRIHLGLHVDETAAVCHWHLPMAHELASWGDARAFDGTVSLSQPLIRPLYGGYSPLEVVAALASGAATEQAIPRGHDLVRAFWRTQRFADDAIAFRAFWRQSLHRGTVADSASPAKNMTLRSDLAGQLAPSEPASGVQVVFRPSPSLFDGRLANNAWLQELPDALTKITWDNPVWMSRATAEKLGIAPADQLDSGPMRTEVIQLEVDGAQIEAATWIVPGHADDCLTVHLGYGRTAAGDVGNGIGASAFVIRPDMNAWTASASVTPKGQTRLIACTQPQLSQEGRHAARSATLAHYVEDPHFAQLHHGGHEAGSSKSSHDNAGHDDHGEAEHHAAHPTMYPEYEYDGYKWGMLIDLTKCIGCNACIAACQAENNIPVVGMKEVAIGRQMHWIRLDRYDDPDDPESRVQFQPVPCMHCEKAPCELVCPVSATVHSDEGLNDMVYNRCVGTRYCSNNCPYKVRRFNYYQYAKTRPETLQMMYNPDVTLRSRGVMEKCSYCVQRIVRARIDARRQGKTITDGAFQTACQAACPTGAIVFGDLNDPESKIVQRRKLPLHYGLLDNLNTQPRTTYLAAVRNPNPKIG